MNKGFVSFIKENGKLIKIICVVIAGVLLIAISSGGSKEKSSVSQKTLDEYKSEIESELSALCSEVEGVGKCRVFVTLLSGEENVYKGSTVIGTRPPQVLGVTVICSGAFDVGVKASLIEMISSLYGIGANRVCVLKLNS